MKSFRALQDGWGEGDVSSSDVHCMPEGWWRSNSGVRQGVSAKSQTTPRTSTGPRKGKQWSAQSAYERNRPIAACLGS
jgi:hypothetical protein